MAMLHGVAVLAQQAEQAHPYAADIGERGAARLADGFGAGFPGHRNLIQPEDAAAPDW